MSWNLDSKIICLKILELETSQRWGINSRPRHRTNSLNYDTMLSRVLVCQGQLGKGVSLYI